MSGRSPPRVYPRVCGGTAAVVNLADIGGGLSPRVRGNLRQLPDACVDLGSIPACAGEPRRQALTATTTKVYPRVCGGTRSRLDELPGGRGLSPRVRGNPPAAAVLPPRWRSIPACAGEPYGGSESAQHAEVYPRVCGGTLPVRRLPDGEAGSIPACAGEPPVCWGNRRLTTVYPRVCGGTWLPTGPKSTISGLSPRVRGNPAPPLRWYHKLRSIPACAGEPGPAASSAGRIRVYPRVCGGTCGGVSMWADSPGLSPRVRGNQRSKFPSIECLRSIPACAGEPAPRGYCNRGCTVYPRVCGGTSPGASSGLAVCGLSPRVRGNLRRAHHPAWQRGSIPACAGEPRGASISPAGGGVYPRVCGGTSSWSSPVNM